MIRLKIVIVNHCHPETPHVCATRGREFARALTRRGHRVVLLTESLRPDDPAPSPTAAADVERTHEWSRPYVLGCPPLKRSLVRGARLGVLPAVVGKTVVAANYALKGHVFGDWSDGARPFVEVLGRAFEPDVVWAVFGNTGAWAIAQQVAGASGCPWVMDMKDSWPHFIPAGLRRWVAGKFRDAAAATALSNGYAKQAAEWFDLPATVVYSGIPADFLSWSPPPGSGDTFTITLTGSIYESQLLETFVRGLTDWLREDLSGADRRRVKFRYFGTDAAVERGVDPLKDLCLVEDAGFVPLPTLRDAQRAARLNVYVKSPRVPFHHKLFELLSAGRPVLCVPSESEEARGLAGEIGGALLEAGAASEVRAVLRRLWQEPAVADTPVLPALAPYTWDAQAEILEKVLATAAEGRP